MAQQNGSPEEFQLDPQRDIVIKLLPDGKVRIIAPMSNKIYCLGLLETAKMAVHQFRVPEQSGIVQAPASVLNELAGVDFQTGRER